MKQVLTCMLRQIAPMFPFPWLQRWTNMPLLLPFYHVVSDELLPHIRHLYPVRTVRQFRDDLDFLLKYYQPVSLQEIGEISQTPGSAVPKFHLTFDDGLRECYDVVMPILLEKGVPTTFFLNSAFVDNRDLMFRYKASLLIESGKRTPADPLTVRYEDRHLLDQWATAAGVHYSEFLADQRPYLSSAQIVEMQSRGFNFGAHSIDHPMYHDLPLEEQLRQTLVSLHDLKTQFGLIDPAFAFPFTDHGVGLSFFEKIQQPFDVPLLTFGSAGVKYDEAPGHFQRFPMEKTTSSTHCMIAAELGSFLLKRMMGRQVVKRR